MTGHDRLRELLAAVALGAATDAERHEVEVHAEGCSECAEELRTLRSATAELALAVPQLEPPPSLKRRVLAEVRASAAHAPAPRQRSSGMRRTWPALAAGLAVLAGVLVWGIAARDGGPGERARIAIAQSDQAPSARGEVTLFDDGSAVMRVRDLPPLAPGQRYELWTVRDGTPRSEGFASIDARGDVVVAAADVGGAQALAVTRELPSNTTAPTETPLVAVSLPPTA